MRSNKQSIRQIRQVIEKISPVTQKAKRIITLGLEGKQWLACALICVLLLPVFAAPVSAANVWNGQSTTATGNSQFEPVNEPQPIWKQAATELNLAMERWLAPAVEPRVAVGKKTVDDAKDKSTEDKKTVKKNDKTDKKNAEEASVEKNVKAKKAAEANKSGETIAVATEDEDDAEALTSEEKPKVEVKVENKAKLTAVSVPLTVNQLPDDERNSVYSYENNLGAPPGQVEMDSANEAAALRVKHRAGIANFSFGIVLASLSGRGINAGAGMAYNSRTWNKSLNANSQNHFTYNVEQSWIAPGFSSGFGYLDSVAFPTGSYGFYKIKPAGLIDADGTRHQFVCKTWSGSACLAFESADGTFIKTGGEVLVSSLNSYANTTFTATYPDGSKVYYAGAFGSGTNRRHYPVIVQDSNGNRVRIAYKTDQSGRIDFITDTLNRKIKFYYETDAGGNPDKLVTVTIPGMGTNEEIQTVRFYYETMPLQSGGFVNTAQVTAPASIRVLKYVYMPATKTGYKYEYHSYYGMIKKITRQVGMSADTTATNTTGTLTEGIFAASTEYDYPSGSTAQSDVPKYTKRTDDWAGRTSTNPAETFYDAPEPSPGYGIDRTSTNTVKDNGFDVEIKTTSYGIEDWKTGLIKETTVKKIYGPGSQYWTLMSKTKYFWVAGTGTSGRRNPKLQKIEITNDAGLTKATEFEYDQYNNQTQIKEYDYAAPDSLGTLLQMTEIGYETGAGWINANLLSLPKSVKTIVGGATVSKTLYEYDQNGSDSTPVQITLRNDIDTATHDTFYNPAVPEWTETICPNGNSYSGGAPESEQNGCVTIYHPGYTAASAYRGNVTKVTGFSNAALTSDANADVKNFNYDIAGNLVSATLSCCSLRTYIYEKASEYAFPVSQTSGSSPQQTTSASYNRNTGLMTLSTDENGQPTSYEYEADTLRRKKVIYPNTGSVETEYSDKLAPGTVPGFVRTTTTLEANKTVQSYSYFDGRGLAIRSATETPDGWSVSAVEYDKLGRAVKSYNPFYATVPNGAIPAGTKFTEVVEYDALGRTPSVRLQDNTTVSTAFSNQTTTPSGFNKTFVTVTDQAGKQRRQVADSLGRIVRVDEPDPSGNLGAVDAPTQPTSYEYDGNDNLTKVIQSNGTTTQERLFKYDSLSRLTHERQIEANTTLNHDGVKVTSGGLWTKYLKYKPDGLLDYGVDARGVKTTFGYDGLNRVLSVTFTDGTPQITYTYDQARTGFFNHGALTRVETLQGDATLRPDTPATATEFDYDKMGRVVKHRQTIGTQTYALEYGYNLAGQLTSEKYPSGKIVSMGYDAKGRLASIADTQRNYLSGLQYQGKGNALSSMTFGNGTTQSFVMNDRLQMESQELKRGSEVLQKYAYGYGQINTETGVIAAGSNNGQLAKIESTIGTAKQWEQRFGYDSIGRLAEAREHRGDTNALSYKQKFDYDRFGNLYRKNASNPTTGQATPIAFAPIEDADISKTTNRFTSGTTYDDVGNVTQDTKFRGLNYWYDANGRMYKTTDISQPNQSNAVYDSAGQRVATQVDGVWTFFIYDVGGKKVAEYGGLQATDEGGVKYVLQDHQGSSRAILSNSGFVNARIDYTAFGEEINSGIGQRTTAQGFGSSNTLNQKYALTERDKATGLDHTWFRKLENQAGRWTSPDPYNGSMNLGSPQSFNRYSYVENQPTNFVDPSGLLLILFTQRVCSQTLDDLIWSLETGEYRASNCQDVIVGIMYIPEPTNNGGFEPGGGGAGTKENECDKLAKDPEFRDFAEKMWKRDSKNETAGLFGYTIESENSEGLFKSRSIGKIAPRTGLEGSTSTQQATWKIDTILEDYRTIVYYIRCIPTQVEHYFQVLRKLTEKAEEMQSPLNNSKILLVQMLL